MTGFFPYRIPTAVAALLAGMLLVAGAACTDGAADADTFQLLASPVGGGTGRAFHAAVPVPGSDDVLLVGGQAADGLALADDFYGERFRFAGRNFTPEVGLLSAFGRVDPVAAQVTGGVVVTGGQVIGVIDTAMAPDYLGSSIAVADGETYLPMTGTTGFTLTGGANGAALVSDGTDLYLIGGRDDTNALSTAIRVWNDGTGQFDATGDTLNDARERHSATLLSSGDILIVGGWGAGAVPLQTAELYDPLTGNVTPIPPPLAPRAEHTATASADGTRVLLFGGFKGVDTVLTAIETAELYTVGGTFTVVPPVAATVHTSRVYHTATRLGNGDIAIVGGITDGSILTPVADLFKPATGLFHQSNDSLNAPRFGHTATLLADGSVLIAGGMSAPTVMISVAERYIPELP